MFLLHTHRNDAACVAARTRKTARVKLFSLCVSCGHFDNADINAATNIQDLAIVLYRRMTQGTGSSASGGTVANPFVVWNFSLHAMRVHFSNLKTHFKKHHDPVNQVVVLLLFRAWYMEFPHCAWHCWYMRLLSCFATLSSKAHIKGKDLHSHDKQLQWKHLLCWYYRYD